MDIPMHDPDFLEQSAFLERLDGIIYLKEIIDCLHGATHNMDRDFDNLYNITITSPHFSKAWEMHQKVTRREFLRAHGHTEKVTHDALVQIAQIIKYYKC